MQYICVRRLVTVWRGRRAAPKCSAGKPNAISIFHLIDSFIIAIVAIRDAGVRADDVAVVDIDGLRSAADWDVRRRVSTVSDKTAARSPSTLHGADWTAQA